MTLLRTDIPVGVTVRFGDAFLLSEPLREAVDLLIVDPPYGKILKEKWDEECYARVGELTHHVLRPGATAYVFGGVGRYRHRPFFLGRRLGLGPHGRQRGHGGRVRMRGQEAVRALRVRYDLYERTEERMKKVVVPKEIWVCFAVGKVAGFTTLKDEAQEWADEGDPVFRFLYNGEERLKKRKTDP